MGALTDVVTAVQGTVSYLRAADPADPALRSCNAFIADPAAVRALIEETAPGRQTDDPQVAASLFVQAYGFRIPSVAIAAHALGLPMPSVAASATSFGIARHRPAAVAYLDRALHDDPDRLADEVAIHLGALIEAVRSTTTVGERLLWGNVASSCTTAFRAVLGATPPEHHADIHQRAERFLAHPAFAGLATLSSRTNCCLWYKTTPAGDAPRWCDDCPLWSTP